MQDTDTPTKLPALWAHSAGGGYITYPVPTASQIGTTNGAASFADGFPPNAFIPLASGGAGPFGKDFNGIFKQITAGVQWYQAGGPIFYDAAFSSAIGGYPLNAVLAQNQGGLSLPGRRWLSTVDNNTSDPDTGGANWASVGGRLNAVGNVIFYVDFSVIGGDTFGTGTSGSPWRSLAHAYSWILANYDAQGFTVEISQASGTADTIGLEALAPIPGATGVSLVLNGGINTSSAVAAVVANGAVQLYISGSGTVTGSSYDLQATQGGFISYQGITLGPCTVSKTFAGANSGIEITGSYGDSGNSPAHWQAYGPGASITSLGVFGTTFTLTISGSPTYTNFAVAQSGGVITYAYDGQLFSGSLGGGRAFLVSTGGGINSFSAHAGNGDAAATIPGTTGSTTAPGWVV